MCKDDYVRMKSDEPLNRRSRFPGLEPQKKAKVKRCLATGSKAPRQTRPNPFEQRQFVRLEIDDQVGEDERAARPMEQRCLAKACTAGNKADLDLLSPRGRTLGIQFAIDPQRRSLDLPPLRQGQYGPCRRFGTGTLPVHDKPPMAETRSEEMTDDRR